MDYRKISCHLLLLPALFLLSLFSCKQQGLERELEILQHARDSLLMERNHLPYRDENIYYKDRPQYELLPFVPEHCVRIVDSMDG